jgi:CDP-4-dehydro-6-deoxyglucose reductase, E3
MLYKITIDSNKESFPAANNETILESALKHGHSLPYGCRNGACGSCKGKLIEGKIFYKNEVTGLSEKESKEGYALFCQAIPESDVIIETKEIDQVGEIDVRKLPCRVTEIEQLNHDVIRLFLKLPSNEHLQFLAGQYIDLLLSEGKRRSFSLANAPHNNNNLELHVRHYTGGLFSEYAFHELKESALLRFEGPLGTFFLREDSERPMIMIAGGTGFAPIKGIIEHALHLDDKRPIHFYWGARKEEDLYLNQLAQDWANEHEHIEYTPVLSKLGDGDPWQGRTGFVHNTILEDIKDITDYEVYTCGPPPMVHAVLDSFVERGLSSEFIYSDSFEFATN